MVNFLLMQRLLKRTKHHFFITAFIALFFLPVVFPDNAFGQIKRKHLYKFRDNNRFEGIKTKKWKPVSGTLDLVSLMLVDKQRREAAAGDSMSIFFYSPVEGDIQPAVFQKGKKYFMNPKKDAFQKGWNTFTWAADIVSEVGIPVAELNGIVLAKKGKRKLFLPISFQNPQSTENKLVMEAVLVPDKDMILDIALFSLASNQPLESWSDLAVKSDAPHIVELPRVLLSGKVTDYTMVATEKSNAGDEFETIRKHSFHIGMFKK